MIAIVALILLAVMLLALCVAIGIISIIVMIDDRRGVRSRLVTDRRLTRAEAVSRHILGVGARNEEKGTNENA